MSGTESEASTARTVRVEQLDVLRGLAILLVLGRHAPIPFDQAGALTPLAKLWMRFGWTGVDLFFVLSGVLVGGLLINELHKTETLDLKRFWLRRAFKIWPSYFALVAFTILLTIRGGSSLGYALGAYLPNLVHLQNYWFTPIIHTWSLSVEEHFYFFLPLALVGLGREGILRRLVPIGAGLMVLCLALRWITMAQIPGYGTHFGDFYRTTMPTHLRIDSLFAGVVIAAVLRTRRDWVAAIAPKRGWLFALGAALVAPMLFLDIETDRFVATGGVLLLTLGYACVLLASLATTVLPEPVTRRKNVLATIGFFSYNIYLWHLVLGPRLVESLLRRGWIAGGQELRWVLAMLLYVIVAIGLGVAMTYLVERPFLRLRDRLFPGRAVAVS